MGRAPMSAVPCAEFLNAASGFLQVPACGIACLAARPLESRESLVEPRCGIQKSAQARRTSALVPFLIADSMHFAIGSRQSIQRQLECPDPVAFEECGTVRLARCSVRKHPTSLRLRKSQQAQKQQQRQSTKCALTACNLPQRVSNWPACTDRLSKAGFNNCLFVGRMTIA